MERQKQKSFGKISLVTTTDYVTTDLSAYN